LYCAPSFAFSRGRAGDHESRLGIPALPASGSHRAGLHPAHPRSTPRAASRPLTCQLANSLTCRSALPKITHHSRTLEKKRKKVRPPSSRGEAMRNLTAPIPVGACCTARVWAAQRGASTLRVRPQSHQNAPRKASYSIAFPCITPTSPVTYHYQQPISQT